MAATNPFLRRQRQHVFEPKDIPAMSMALDDASKASNLPDDSAAREVTAMLGPTRVGPELESALRADAAIAESEHRIANDLAIIAAMVRAAALKLRTDRHRDPDAAIAVLGDLSTKIDAIAHLHRLLIKQRGQGQIELSEYLGEVVKAAKSGLANSGSRIAFEARTEFRQHAAHAAIMGLFLSEAITNALKHAEGDIRVVLSMSAQSLMLEVADNGPGPPAGFDEARSNGFRLMHALAERLSGRLEFDKSSTGFSIRLAVPPNEGE
jgi:two-component sensor histidine kinase